MTEAEVDAILAELERAGLIILGTDAHGNETWTLTPKGIQVARRFAMRAPDDDAVPASLRVAASED